MATGKPTNTGRPQPQPQPNHKQPPSNGGRGTYTEDRRPQNIESVQPPRPQPTKSDKG